MTQVQIKSSGNTKKMRANLGYKTNLYLKVLWDCICVLKILFQSIPGGERLFQEKRKKRAYWVKKKKNYAVKKYDEIFNILLKKNLLEIYFDIWFLF